MPAGESTPNWVLDPRTTWSNTHENFTVRNLDGVYLLANAPATNPFTAYKDTADAIQKLIRQARGIRELRPVGAGWSLSPMVATGGRLLNNKNLKLHIRFRDQRQFDPAFVGQPNRIHCCQAGMTIKAVSRVLERENLSLPTSGASNGQTIAGALSTGTHGAAIGFGSIPEFVVGLHLATGKAQTIWLERESRPVLSEAMVGMFGAQLIRSDELFNAALVGLGGFGMLLSVTIEAVPRYLLEVHTKKLKLNAALKRAMDAADFTALPMGHAGQRPYSVDLLVNPHRPDSAYVTLMYKRRYRNDYPRHDFNNPDSALGDDALNVMGDIMDAIPVVGTVALPGIITSQLDERYEEVAGAKGLHSEVFTSTKIRGNVSSMGIAVSAENASRALQLVLDTHDAAGPFAGALGVRFVKGTDATLGFTRFPRTCVIEADGVQNDLSRQFNRALWRAFDQSDIEHTLHWGKLNNLTRRRVRSMYGDDRVDRWLNARNKLLAPAARPVFASDFLRKAGLAD